ncbi:MAG: hypothetical protein ACI9HK_001112, partial [Pirellulaceae bacterium]
RAMSVLDVPSEILSRDTNDPGDVGMWGNMIRIVRTDYLDLVETQIISGNR